MNLEDVKQQWTALDERLERSIRLNQALLRQSSLQKAGASLRRLTGGLYLELAINVVVLVAVGSFMVEHIRDAKFLLPALLLHLSAIAFVAFGIRQLVALHRVDYAEPVVEIQKLLELLRIERIRATKWTFLIAPLLWVPLLLVLLKGMLGVDAYRIFDRSWLIANILFGVAVIPLMLWVSRFADRFRNRPMMRELMNDIAGHNLVAARKFVDELMQFEREAE